MAVKDLQSLREDIDRLDAELQRMLNQRAELAKAVAEVKIASDPDAQFYRPEREASVLSRIRERNKGPLSDDEMVRIFREVMSACLALEQPMTIAFLGPEGTFTQAAALKHFGHSIGTLASDTVDAVFQAVESGEAHYGVVPVENSTEGVVSHTLDMLMNSPLSICGEVELRIHHYLLGSAKKLEDVSRVYAHQQALAQCRNWLDTHLPQAECLPASSNAEAARLIGDDPSAAAVAGRVAGELYGLQELANNIEDEADNTTRFLVIGKGSTEPSGNDKTSLLVSVHNRPGALTALLQPIARRDISMTRIESRPSRKGLWEYVFFIDLEGHVSDENLASAVAELEQQSAFCKVLGSYPRAVL